MADRHSKASRQFARARGASHLRAYAHGGRIGHSRAAQWLGSPACGNPANGGTLQGIIFDYAKRLAAASTEVERSQVSGEIVGFCYRLENQEHAVALQEHALGMG